MGQSQNPTPNTTITKSKTLITTPNKPSNSRTTTDTSLTHSEKTTNSPKLQVFPLSLSLSLKPQNRTKFQSSQSYNTHLKQNRGKLQQKNNRKPRDSNSNSTTKYINQDLD
ncbi:hypothetical protein M758_10G113900 [Ceratodon purpureus]|nr:hypothetical protein M758_10G113900 [Ceratodon purpureus]